MKKYILFCKLEIKLNKNKNINFSVVQNVNEQSKKQR